MKKIFSIIVAICLLFLYTYNVFATAWTSVEKLDARAEPLLMRAEERPRSGYLFEMNGETYIIGNRVSKYSLPIKKTSIFPEREYVCTDDGYMTRDPSFDDLWSDRGIPKMSVVFYDKNLNRTGMYMFDRNVCAIGYFKGMYYCQLFGTWKTYKSCDTVNWEETDEIIPRQTKQLIYAGDSVSFDRTNMIAVNYEYTANRDFYSTFGDWMIKVDENYNFYLSNDNIYFVKIDMPYCTLNHEDTASANSCNSLHKETIRDCDLRCIYEHNNNIVVDIRTGPWVQYWRLSIPKQDIYDKLNRQKTAPYVKYNSNILGFEVAPSIQDDYTLVPIRFLFEQMGAEVTWNQETKTATITQDNTAITFGIDDTNASVNGSNVSMDIPARLINGKTMVPVRFLSEELGYTVDWDGENRIITIE